MDTIIRFLLMLIGIFVLLVLALLGASYGAEKWTGTDTALESAFVLTMLIDRNQTMQAIDGGYEEVGWARHFIGSHPSEGRINSYFALATAAHAAIAYLLPQPWRLGWQSFWIGVEVNTIDRNREFGLGVKIGF